MDQEFLDKLHEHLKNAAPQAKELRPDQLLLDRVVTLIEGKVDVKLIFEMARTGPFHSSQGSVELYPIEHKFSLSDEKSKEGVEVMWEEFFKPAAEFLARQIIDGGFNVCFPSQIENPNLTAETGALQVFRFGNKVSVYMVHEHCAANSHTTVKLKILVGNHDNCSS